MFFSFPPFPPFSRSFFQTTLPVQPAPHLPAQSRPLPTLTLQEQATVHIKNPPPDPGNEQIREPRRIPTERMDSSSTSLKKGEVGYKERRLFLKKTVRVSSSTIQKRHALSHLNPIQTWNSKFTLNLQANGSDSSNVQVNPGQKRRRPR